MNYPKAKSFDSSLVSSKIMGPNPLLLTEELLQILEQGTEICSKILEQGTEVCSKISLFHALLCFRAQKPELASAIDSCC